MAKEVCDATKAPVFAASWGRAGVFRAQMVGVNAVSSFLRSMKAEWRDSDRRERERCGSARVLLIAAGHRDRAFFSLFSELS